ncbi:MAG: TlpA family protein disulfide reductase [Planctomycetota bacterium]|jgi:thiol-disulfide isomerase/thioredoxin/outer membrane lipoprotein-sorting protein
MKPFVRNTKGMRHCPSAVFKIALVAALPALWAGCQRVDEPPTPDSEGPQGGAASAPARPTEPSPEDVAPGIGVPAKAPGKPSTPGGQLTAREALDAMVAAYKDATTYADNGYVQMSYRLKGRQEAQEPRKDAYLVAFSRPEKIRVQAYGGIVLSNGERMYATMAGATNQVLQKEAPAEVTIESIYPDHLLGDAMAVGPTRDFSWLPLQLILLMADDPLNTLLYQSEEPALLEPAALGDKWCHRAEIRREDGTGVFWIDQESYVLRRFELPKRSLRGRLAARHQVTEDQIQELSVMAEFIGAELDGRIDPVAFEFMVPPKAEIVEQFVPDAVAQLGQKVSDFAFVDLEGNAVSPDTLKDKIAVLDFWATWCKPCRQTLPQLEAVYQKYKDNPKVAFLAVSLDATTDSLGQPAVEDETLRDTFKEWGVTIPIVRDPNQHTYTALEVVYVPTSVILGPKGLVQDRAMGGGGVLPGTGGKHLATKLDQLLAGQDLYPETLESFQRTSKLQKDRFDELFQACLKNQLFVDPMLMMLAEVAERSLPESLNVTQLWSCTELTLPGNILVAPRQDGPPRLLVVDGGTSVAEIGIKGAVTAMHPLALPEEQFVAFLRTAAGADGRRYFLGSATGAQQCYLFDEAFKLLVAYPEDALKNPHDGIADVQFTDLDGDGTPELGVGYWGVIGVQGASLEGKRVWYNRSLAIVQRLAAVGPDAQGQQELLCTHRTGSLVFINAKGERAREVTVPDFAVQWIVSADLDGDGKPELCGLAPTEAGQFVALGLSPSGEVLWHYPLPHGLHQYPIEAVQSGRLLGDGPGQWILAAADGSIHVLAADGTPIDRFQYGALLTGIATAEWDGKRVLLVSSVDPVDPTVNTVDAWQVEPPDGP